MKSSPNPSKAVAFLRQMALKMTTLPATVTRKMDKLHIEEERLDDPFMNIQSNSLSKYKRPSYSYTHTSMFYPHRIPGICC